MGYDALVDRDSPDYRELGLDYLLPQAAEEKLLENPWLFRAPIVRNGRQATVGYCPDVWKTWEEGDYTTKICWGTAPAEKCAKKQVRSSGPVFE